MMMHRAEGLRRRAGSPTVHMTLELFLSLDLRDGINLNHIFVDVLLLSLL